MDSRLIFLRWRRTAPVNPVVLRVRILGRRSLRGEAPRASTRPHAGAASVLTGVTQEGSRTGPMVESGQGRRGADRQIRLQRSLRADAEP